MSFFFRFTAVTSAFLCVAAVAVHAGTISESCTGASEYVLCETRSSFEFGAGYIHGFAEAKAGPDSFPVPGPDDDGYYSASAATSIEYTLLTPGPVRPGLLNYSIGGASCSYFFGSAGAFAEVVGVVRGYGPGMGEHCGGGTFGETDLMLGTTYTVRLKADASGYTIWERYVDHSSGEYYWEHISAGWGSGYVDMVLWVTEASGEPVRIYDVAELPEPGTGLLVAIPLAAALVRRGQRRIRKN
jgi:hypothetical protein